MVCCLQQHRSKVFGLEATKAVTNVDLLSKMLSQTMTFCIRYPPKSTSALLSPTVETNLECNGVMPVKCTIIRL